MRKNWKAALGLLASMALLGTGCGGHGSDYTVTTTVTQPGTYEPFTLTLQNNTNMTLLPGPILAAPYDPAIPAVSIPPGGTATYSIGFLPSSVTVGATGVGTFSSYTYPTQILYLGIDYSTYATGATFIYH